MIGRRYEAGLRAGASISTFAIGRAIRLYPLYVLGVIVGVISAVIDPLVTPGWSYTLFGLAWRAVCLVPILDLHALPAGIQSFPLNIPAWSLWCEILANGLFCILCRLPRWLMAVPLLFGVVVLLMTALSEPHFSAGGDGRTVIIGLGRIGFGFFAGVMLARLCGDN